MCNLALRNRLRVYDSRNDRKPPMASTMGKNCNPGFFDMQAWFGTVEQQLAWAQSHRIQFYGNEAQLPREEDIPFGVFVTGTQFRHPLSRLYSLFLENPNVEYSVLSVGKLTDRSLSAVSALSTDVIARYEAHVRALISSAWFKVANDVKIELTGPESAGNTKDVFEYRTHKANNFTQYLLMSYRNQDLASFAGMKYYEIDKNRKFLKNLPSRELLKTKRYQKYSEIEFFKGLRILEKFTFVSVIEGIEM